MSDRERSDRAIVERAFDTLHGTLHRIDEELAFIAMTTSERIDIVATVELLRDKIDAIEKKLEL